MRTLVALLAAFASATPVIGQVGSAQRIAVLTESGTPVVAAEFLLTVGPGDEEPSLAGLSHLAARAVLAPLRETFDSLGVHVNVTAHKDAVSFSLIAAPEAWEKATATLLSALFRDAPDSASVAGERRAILAELAGRAANPADAATRELDAAFFGALHPWGRPTVGTPQSLARITVNDVEEYLHENFTPERALAAVAGPVTEEVVRAHLGPLLGTGQGAAVELLPFRAADRPVRRDYDSITTWVAASFRFPETGDEEALRFVANLAANSLSFSASQRSVYDVAVQVVPRVGGGEIRLQVVIPPGESSDWAERVDEAVSDLGTRTLIEDVFDASLRRYRGERILAFLNPEDRARAAARQLLVNGRFSGLVPDLSEMTQARVRAAARSLSRPTIVVLGPNLD